tara:strand:+ start:148552 stop:148878 length:327 start_codon:yes stop_codon:yes gene_type:complete
MLMGFILDVLTFITCKSMMEDRLEREEIREKVFSYLSNNFFIDFTDDITPHTNLFTSGIIDSFGFIALITFLESEFVVRIGDECLLNGGLSSLESIITVVEELTRASD